MSRNNMRLISVVMRSNNKDNRSSDTIGMMEYGYSVYDSETIFEKDKYTGKILVSNSEKREYNYYLDKDVKIIVDKNRKDVLYTTEVKLNNVKAPLSKDSIVGNLILDFDGKRYIYNLKVKEDIKKAGYFKIFKNHLKDIVTGNVRK